MHTTWRALLRRSKFGAGWLLAAARRRLWAGPGVARPLTPGEVLLVRAVFGTAIDVDRVLIHNRCYLPLGLQPVNCAMSPNGRIYFHPSRFVPDFSLENKRLQHWWMHEMVHVWQHQLSYPVRCRGAVRLGLNYAYRLAPGKRLSDFNMEAQGDVLADYFALKFLADPTVMAQPQHAGQLALFEQVLADFLRDGSDRKNLPRPYL